MNEIFGWGLIGIAILIVLVVIIAFFNEDLALAIAMVLMVLGLVGTFLFLGWSTLNMKPDDRICVHRVFVGKVYVCDVWGTTSPTDPRP